MADYTGTTWVDDDGSGTTGTVGTAARMNNIEAGILDAATNNRIGTFAAMPAAAAGNKNWFYIATDTDGTGGLYRSDGAAWTKMPVGSLSSNNTRFGLGGLLSSVNADRAAFYANYNATTDRLIDTSKPGWALFIGAASDAFVVYRAVATAGSPTFTAVLSLSSGGVVTSPAATLGGDLSGALPNPLVSTLSAMNLRFGTAGGLRSNAAGFSKLYANFDPVTGTQLDATLPSWQFSLDGRSGTDQFQVFRSPPGSTTFVAAFTIDATGQVTMPGAAHRLGTGAELRSAAADSAAMTANYNSATDRCIDTSKPAWRMVLGNGTDQYLFQRAPATTGSPAFVTVAKLQNDGSMIGGNPPWVTSLPTTGPNGGALQDGQECYYVADATTGTVWHLKYRAAETGAFKWYVVGGSGIESVVDTTQSTSSTSYTDLTTAGPSVTTPLAGDYEMEISALVGGTGGANRCFVSPKKNLAATADADGTEASVAGGSTNTATMYRRKKLTVAAGDVYKLQYSVLNATSVGFGTRALKMTPIRVG